MNDLLDRLAPFVSRICGPMALGSADDAAHEALVVNVRQLHTLREPAALYGWTRSIAAREASRIAKRATAKADGLPNRPPLRSPRAPPPGAVDPRRAVVSL